MALKHLHTNANLTGPITSVGNATSIASQTGTGTKFVVDTSPTLVTGMVCPAIDGSVAANGDLTLQGTSDSTRTTSYVNLQPNGGNVGVGTVTPAMKLDVVGGALLGGAVYISPTNTNTLNSGFADAADGANMWINYRGYNDGQVYSRDLKIGNGKGTQIAIFVGSTGNLGIQTASPTAAIHLPAATAAANTASMKITPGTVATSPVSGNIESDGTHLYWTNSSAARKTVDVLTSGDNLVIAKTSGLGIQVDTAAPTFPWKDLFGHLRPDTGGAGAPTLAAVRGGLVREFFYGAADKMDMDFHVPHDYVPGSDIFIHIHWGHNGTAISGDFVVTFAHTYAKGHNQTIFPAEKSVVMTYSTVDVATTPRWIHRIDEVQLSSSGGSASLMDSALLEPDGVALVNMTITTIPTITGGSPNLPFIHFADIHYQSTGIGTKQKAPNFYT